MHHFVRTCCSAISLRFSQLSLRSNPPMEQPIHFVRKRAQWYVQPVFYNVEKKWSVHIPSFTHSQREIEAAKRTSWGTRGLLTPANMNSLQNEKLPLKSTKGFLTKWMALTQPSFQAAFWDCYMIMILCLNHLFYCSYNMAGAGRLPTKWPPKWALRPFKLAAHATKWLGSWKWFPTKLSQILLLYGPGG